MPPWPQSITTASAKLSQQIKQELLAVSSLVTYFFPSFVSSSFSSFSSLPYLSLHCKSVICNFSLTSSERKSKDLILFFLVLGLLSDFRMASNNFAF